MLTMTNKRTTALGKRLKAIRERLKLTQEEAATRVHVARRTWHLWEIGKSKPQPAYLMLIDMLDNGQL